MAITIVPTGFEGFGDAFSRGIEQGFLAKQRKQELEAEMKIKEKAKLDIGDLATIALFESSGVLPDGSKNAYLNQFNELSNQATQATGVPAQSGGIQPPNMQPMTVNQIQGLPRVGLNDVYINNQLKYETDKMFARNTAKKVAEQRALLQPKLEEKQMEQEIKSSGKSQEASQKALGNFGRMQSAIKLFADYYADALKEGGVGSLPQKLIGKAKLAYGGEAGENLVATGQLYGQGVEMSLSSIPIMTGQNRFVESLRNALTLTYPTGNEGAKLAAGKLDQTLVNMYMISKIMDRLGIDINNPSAGDNLTVEDTDYILNAAGYNIKNKKWNPSNIAKLSDEEKQELENIRKDTLGSLNSMQQRGEYLQKNKKNIQWEK